VTKARQHGPRDDPEPQTIDKSTQDKKRGSKAVMDKLAAQGGTPVRSTPFPPWPQFDEAERAAVLRVLDSRNWWATEGTEVRAFESEWTAFTGAGAAALTNGTAALEVALAALDVGQGDEVIVPAWSFMATIGAVLAANAVPVIVDVEASTGTMDVAAAEAALTDRTRALVPVHIGGGMADLDGLRKLAGEHDLVVLEDAAQAHGSTWRGQHAGSLGDAGTFSFQASKNMTAGEGGAVVSRRPEILERVVSLINCGRRPGQWYYRHFELAGNLRLSEWQGAVLRAQLQRFPAQQEVRSANVEFLNSALAELAGVAPLGRLEGCTSQGNYDYMVNFAPERFPERDKLRTALLAEGMPLTTAYPPMHKLEMFSREGGLAPHIRDTSAYPAYPSLHMPVAEYLSETAIWFKTEVLTGSREDAQSVLDAIEKVHGLAAEVAELEPTAY
jgi:dTDP-4-amino-4,6-dideoxygalactose transaminase